MTEGYKEALACLCRQSARLQYITERGILPSKEIMARELNLLEDAKLALLKEKKALGYEDGLSFMEDAVFQGFAFENGAFVGDASKAKLVINSFLEKEDDDKNHFQYEVGNLLYFHARAYRGENLGLEYEAVKQHTTPMWRKKLRKIILSLRKKFAGKKMEEK